MTRRIVGVLSLTFLALALLVPAALLAPLLAPVAYAAVPDDPWRSNEQAVYIPYWRADSKTRSFLVVHNSDVQDDTEGGSGAADIADFRLTFYDATCRFATNKNIEVTHADLEIFEIGCAGPGCIPTPGVSEGAIKIEWLSNRDGGFIAASTFVVDTVTGDLLRFHHIGFHDNKNDWSGFDDEWIGPFFDESLAGGITNELFLFCPQGDLRDDLKDEGGAEHHDGFGARKVDIVLFDDDENEIVSVAKTCPCILRVPLKDLTTDVSGTSGNVVVFAIGAGCEVPFHCSGSETDRNDKDNNDFLAYMRWTAVGPPRANTGGYLHNEVKGTWTLTNP